MQTSNAALVRLVVPGTRVAALDATAFDWLGQYAPEAQRLQPGANERAELALGLAALDGLDRQAASACLFQARTWIAPVVIARAGPDCALDADAWRALAFELLVRDGDTALYQFNLATYKTVPDWLNARFWANPERWEP